MTRRLRFAATAVAVATAVLAPSTAHAEPTVLGGRIIRTAAEWSIWTLDAACHFGPIQRGGLDDVRMDVHGWATAPGASAVTIRCWVEHGSGVWTDVFQARTDAPASVTSGTSHLWSHSYDRVCVSASAEYGFMDWLVTDTYCERA